MLRFLSNLLITAWLGFLAAVAVECHRAAPLAGVQGLEPVGKQTVPDLPDRIEQAIWRRSTSLTLNETEVNRYLAGTLAGKQRGLSAGFAAFDRVALSFQPGLCRVWLCWTCGGRPVNASLDFTITRHKHEFIIEPQRGTLGRLPAFRGAMTVLLPALRSLSTVFDEEINGIFQMNKIHFEKNRVVLDPRFESEK